MSELRIACINPRCRRTAPADRHVGAQEVICGKCFRSLPANIRNRRKALDRRSRKLDRLARKPRFDGRGSQFERIAIVFDRAWEANWLAMVTYFREPGRPEGLDAFLEIVGL